MRVQYVDVVVSTPSGSVDVNPGDEGPEEPRGERGLCVRSALPVTEQAAWGARGGCRWVTSEGPSDSESSSLHFCFFVLLPHFHPKIVDWALFIFIFFLSLSLASY